jgi:hypothetical protein
MKTYLMKDLKPADRAAIESVAIVAKFNDKGERAVFTSNEKPPKVGTLTDTLDGNVIGYVATEYLDSSPLDDLYRESIVTPSTGEQKKKAVGEWKAANDLLVKAELDLSIARTRRHDACMELARAFGNTAFMLNDVLCTIGTRRGGAYCLMRALRKGKGSKIEVGTSEAESPLDDDDDNAPLSWQEPLGGGPRVVVESMQAAAPAKAAQAAAKAPKAAPAWPITRSVASDSATLQLATQAKAAAEVAAPAKTAAPSAKQLANAAPARPRRATSSGRGSGRGR